MLSLEDIKPKKLIHGRGDKKTLIFPSLYLLETLYDNTACSPYCTNNCTITLIAEESQC